jgi:alkylation response protein AidB-like acyl-CoA dehydrogenase
MDFDYSEKVQKLRAELEEFMDEHVYPNEKTYADQHASFEDRWSIPPIMEELKEKAKAGGALEPLPPRLDLGAGLTNLEYAPLCEIMGRSPIGPRSSTATPRTREHGGPGTLRDARAAGEVAQAAAGRRDPLVLLYDRARRRLLGRDEHTGQR